MFDQPHPGDRPAPEQSHGASNGGSNGGGGRELVNYRLAELERRMKALEESLKPINDAVIRIEQNVGNLSDKLASKTYVLTLFGATGGVALATLIAHIVLRAVGS